MAGQTTDNVQVWSSLNKPTNLKITRWATRLGMSKSMLINLCVQAGIDQVIRVFAPEESMSGKKLEAIVKAMVRNGAIQLPAGTKVPAKRVSTSK